MEKEWDRCIILFKTLTGKNLNLSNNSHVDIISNYIFAHMNYLSAALLDLYWSDMSGDEDSFSLYEACLECIIKNKNGRN